MAIWIGVDVGGTFTDFIAHDEARDESFTFKTPSTPHDPAEAIIVGLRRMGEAYGLGLRAIAQVAHGTTVGTNTLIQRKGGKVSLLTTRGFRDVLEIGRQLRPRHFDIYRDHPPPVVPRWRRYEVDERVLADGTVRRPLTDAEIAGVIARVCAGRPEAVAVCFLFSYLAPEHEQRMGKGLAAAAPDVGVSLSCEVQPEFREYERFSTTVLNAYLQPIMARYLGSLEAGLRAETPQADVVISQSSGGLMSLAQARRFPIRTALSGPAAGVLGAIEVARQAGRSSVITFDMGGTSADVAMVRNLEPAHSFDRLIGGFPIRLPSVDINSVGAGGGSIAWFDRDGALKVGPLSAGAVPGPAAYGAGGDQATVTDANLALGRLSPRGLLDGVVPLDVEAARRVMRPIAHRLGFAIERAAHGVLEIVVSNMCRAIRSVSVERGYDPRECSLLAFGGAGPLHARNVAAGLEMKEILVPPAPGILCAAGLTVSDLKEDFVQTVRLTLDGDASLVKVAEIQRALFSRAQKWFADERILPELRRLRAALDMRYAGQNFELWVPLSPGPVSEPAALPSATHLRAMFFDVHERAYGYHNPNDRVEVVNCRLTASGRRQRAQPARRTSAAARPGHPLGRRGVWFDPDRPVETPVYRRESLAPGQVLAGPAVIEQFDATTLVFPGDVARVDHALNLVIEVGT
jgi:N-methylhydantoinase A